MVCAWRGGERGRRWREKEVREKERRYPLGHVLGESGEEREIEDKKVGKDMVWWV